MIPLNISQASKEIAFQVVVYVTYFDKNENLNSFLKHFETSF